MKEQITDLVESIVDEKPVTVAEQFEEVMLEKLRQKVADHEPVVAASLFYEEEVEEDELVEGGYAKDKIKKGVEAVKGAGKKVASYVKNRGHDVGDDSKRPHMTGGDLRRMKSYSYMSKDGK